MGWAIAVFIVFVCAFWFVSRIYSKAKDAPKKDQTQGVSDNADDSSSGSDSDE